MTTNQEQTSQQNLNQEQTQKANDKEFNFAQLRKKQEQTEYELQKERDERTRLSQELQRLQTSSVRTPDADTDDLDNDNEPYIDKKVLKKHLKRVKEESKSEMLQTAKQIAQEIVEQERKANEPLRLKTLYPDFNEVLNEANAQKLQEKYPELAEKILKVPDDALRKEMAYQTIKSFGLHKPEAPKSDMNAQIAQKQRSLYYYPSGVATPSSGAPDCSEAGQKTAYANMQKLIKNRRS